MAKIDAANMIVKISNSEDQEALNYKCRIEWSCRVGEVDMNFKVMLQDHNEFAGIHKILMRDSMDDNQADT